MKLLINHDKYYLSKEGENYEKIITWLTPKKDGFYISIESIPYKSTWMIWSLMKMINKKLSTNPWSFCTNTNTINKYEPVKMIINETNWADARKMLDSNIALIDIKYQDSCARDMAPIYLINKIFIWKSNIS